MYSTEFIYKLGTIRRIAKKVIRQGINILFILTSLATLALMAYEYGYAISETGQFYVTQGFRIILPIFFFGSLINIILNRKGIRQEKGIWIEIIVLLLLLFVMITQESKHFPSQKWLQKTDHLMMHILLLLISVIQISKVIVSTLQRHIRPEIMFAASFLFIIFAGTALLMLPKAHQGPLAFIDALFTSTSAVCITGLTTVDISSTFTLTGQVIILLLIQIGGIGVMTFTSFIAMSFFTQTSFVDQMALKNILSEESMNNIFKTLMYIFFTTVVVEAIGSWLIWWEVQDISPNVIPNRIFFAIFHSISAFCNAGFSTLPDNLHNPAVRHLYGFQGWISLLIIIGGIGFPIVFNYGKLINHKIRNLIYQLTGVSKRMPSHVRIVTITTRIVIHSTIFLLVGGTLLFWIFENNGTLQDLPFRGKLVVSLFNATTPRTAGFNNISMDMLSAPTIVLLMFLMWIGASPLSTGGGIKTTTFTVTLKSIFNILKNKENVEIFKRQIPNINVRRAYTITILSILWIGLTTLLITIVVPQSEITPALFEVISAISTVGLSLDFTPQLNVTGKIIISLTMLVGRVGLIVLLSGMIHQQSTQNYSYAEENVIL